VLPILLIQFTPCTIGV